MGNYYYKASEAFDNNCFSFKFSVSLSPKCCTECCHILLGNLVIMMRKKKEQMLKNVKEIKFENKLN